MRDFDADPGFNELLKPGQQQRLLHVLERLTGARWWFSPHPQSGAHVVQYQLNDLVWLGCESAGRDLQAGCDLVEFVLGFVGKYRLAATLHIDTTEASYSELKRQHSALQHSEQRYRELSDSLQQQVDQQVASLREVQQQLYDSARLRSVGQLAAGVAHEINNPIGFISSNLKVAREYLDELVAKIPEPARDPFIQQDFVQLLEESTNGARRIAGIVADLKTFSNINQEPCQACDINALLETACHLIEAEYGARLKLRCGLGVIELIQGYPARLSQAFFNLLDNAALATDGQGPVIVETRPWSTGVEICISDQGTGMSDEVRERAFDPFFTTRDVGAGTGLGLTVARDVVLAHRGEISLGSGQPVGTQVSVRLLGSSA